MCGIIGIVGKEEVADRLVDGLRRMEYRGYDSAGVCTVHDGELIRRRAPGKLMNLVKELAVNPAPGLVGIAHTRWATHGAPRRPMRTPMPRKSWRWSTMALSRTSALCAKRCRPRAACLNRKPIPRW
jgi:glucosamine 6-phosphate synthetase-like amidotransferase/phosphosugar isomerase protein